MYNAQKTIGQLQQVIADQAGYIRQLESDKTFYLWQLKQILDVDGLLVTENMESAKTCLAQYVPAGWKVSRNTEKVVVV